MYDFYRARENIESVPIDVLRALYIDAIDNSIFKVDLNKLINDNAFTVNTHDYGNIDVLPADALKELL